MDPQIEATLRTWGLVHLGPKFEDEKIEWATFLELEDGDLKQLCSNLNDLVKLRKHHRLMRRQPEFWQDIFVTPPAETKPSEIFTVPVNRNRSGSPCPPESRNVEETMETEEMKIDENVAKIDMQKKEKMQARRDKRKQKKKQFRAERRRWHRQAKENAKAAAQDDNAGSASGSVATDEALPPSPSEGPVPGPVPTDGASPPSPSEEPVAEEMAETKTD